MIGSLHCVSQSERGTEVKRERPLWGLRAAHGKWRRRSRWVNKLLTDYFTLSSSSALRYELPAPNKTSIRLFRRNLSLYVVLCKPVKSFSACLNGVAQQVWLKVREARSSRAGHLITFPDVCASPLPYMHLATLFFIMLNFLSDKASPPQYSCQKLRQRMRKVRGLVV